MQLHSTSLRYLNIVLLICCISFFGMSIVSWLSPTEVELPLPFVTKQRDLPHSFVQRADDSNELYGPFLELESHHIDLQLPDLRTSLVYYGSNNRPDSSQENPAVYIGIKGTPSNVAVIPNSPIYLSYVGKQKAARWEFSKNNEPTSIWITVSPSEKEALFAVRMKDSDGSLLDEPREFSSFTLTQTKQPINQQGSANWEIGSIRADAALLVKQKAVWFGQDLFLHHFGGDEFAHVRNKERLEFKNPDNPYHCFIEQGSCLVFEDNRWIAREPGPETRMKSLLVVQTINERTIVFDLWDPEGKGKIVLQLHRTQIPRFSTENYNIKLVGARSRRDWIAEVGKSRMLLRLDDWLLFYDGKWQKITELEMLENYINGTLKGPLIILEGTEKVGNEISLVARVFDETRSQELPLKISLSQSWKTSALKKKKVPDDDDDDDEEDDDDDDDDEDDDDDDELSYEDDE